MQVRYGLCNVKLGKRTLAVARRLAAGIVRRV